MSLVRDNPFLTADVKMNLPDIPLLGMLREKMSWLSTRQSVLSQNVANADVAGYQAQDLKPLDFEQLLRNSVAPQSISLTLTDARHIAVDDQPQPFGEAPAADPDTTASGNTVSPEQEMLKISDTQAQYQAATNLYAKSVQMMRTAIDGNH